MTNLKKLLEKLQAMLNTTKCADFENGTQSSKQLTFFHKHLICMIGMHGVLSLLMLLPYQILQLLAQNLNVHSHEISASSPHCILLLT